MGAVSLKSSTAIGLIASQSASLAPHWLLDVGINAKLLVLYNEPQRRVKEDRRGSPTFLLRILISLCIYHVTLGFIAVASQSC